jgi:hypothetical protein
MSVQGNPTMSNNSNPNAGTGTADDISDEALDQYMADEGDVVEDIADTESDAEGEEPDAEDKEGADDSDAKNDASDPLIKLDDGTELKLSELAQGYQRQDDYTRKTQALAARAKEFDASAARFSEQATRREQQLEHAFEDVVSLLASRMPREPDVSLAYSDPVLFNQQLATFHAAQREIQGILGAQKATRAKIAQANEANEAAWYEGEMRKVTEAFPIASDPVKGRAFWQSALETGRSLGFTDDELAVADARQVTVLARLAQYEARDKAKAGGTTTKAAVVSQVAKRPAPIVRQPVRPQPQASKALRSFRETGRVSDAERAFAAMDFG